MTITLNLKPEVEADLLAQAQAAGLPLDQFLNRKLEALTHAGPVLHEQLSGASGVANQWEKELDEWLDTFPQQPLLSEKALKRESWYSDR